MTDSNHYITLDISPTATLAEIKQAYRRLVKLFHPDSNLETADHETIIRINAAYEVLGDPHRRQSYDQHLFHQHLANEGFSSSDAEQGDQRANAYASQHPWGTQTQRQQTAAAQKQYRVHRRQTGQDADEQLQRWLKQVYGPVNRLLCRILNALADQLESLSADPFDDQLMEAFQAYLAECRHYLNEAQRTFRSQPNPAAAASAAVHLYYCLNQVGDGIDELELFTLNYDDHYLHTGQELFRIATGLQCEAQSSIP